MNKKRFYYFLTVLNIFVLLAVIFTEFKFSGAVFGIALLILTFIIGLKLETDSSKIKSYKIRSYEIKVGGIEALVFGLIGLYSMMQLTEKIDIVWIYYLLFNLFIISQVYLKINKRAELI